MHINRKKNIIKLPNRKQREIHSKVFEKMIGGCVTYKSLDVLHSTQFHLIHFVHIKFLICSFDQLFTFVNVSIFLSDRIFVSRSSGGGDSNNSIRFNSALYCIFVVTFEYFEYFEMFMCSSFVESPNHTVLLCFTRARLAS